MKKPDVYICDHCGKEYPKLLSITICDKERQVMGMYDVCEAGVADMVRDWVNPEAQKLSANYPAHVEAKRSRPNIWVV